MIPIDIAKRRAVAKQREVLERLERPVSMEAARDIAIVMTTEDGGAALGVGLYRPPDDKVWCLSPDEADELALSIVRCAAAVRRMQGDGE